MATERLTMRQLREILRQKLLLKRSHRDVARSVGVSAGSVGSAVSRAKLVGLDWTAIESMADDALDERLYGSRGGAREDRVMPDPQAIRMPCTEPALSRLARTAHARAHDVDRGQVGRSGT